VLLSRPVGVTGVFTVCLAVSRLWLWVRHATGRDGPAAPSDSDTDWRTAVPCAGAHAMSHVTRAPTPPRAMGPRPAPTQCDGRCRRLRPRQTAEVFWEIHENFDYSRVAWVTCFYFLVRVFAVNELMYYSPPQPTASG
jgi:hypothetical protein